MDVKDNEIDYCASNGANLNLITKNFTDGGTTICTGQNQCRLALATNIREGLFFFFKENICYRLQEVRRL
jgi:hypothetical protein